MLSGTERSEVQSKHLPAQRCGAHGVARVVAAFFSDPSPDGLFTLDSAQNASRLPRSSFRREPLRREILRFTQDDGAAQDGGVAQDDGVAQGDGVAQDDRSALGVEGRNG